MTDLQTPSVSTTSADGPTGAGERGPGGVRLPIYRRRHYSSIAAFVVAMALIKIVISPTAGTLNLFDLGLLYSTAALGYYLILGVAGRFAFSQQFMMAAGAFLAGYLSDHTSFLLSVLGGIALTIVLSAWFGYLMRRTNAFYFAIATLAFAQIGLTILQRWTAFSGQNGTHLNIPAPTVLGKQFSTGQDFFWMFLGVLAVVLVLVAMIERSPLKRRAVAGRDLPLVSRTLGIPVDRVHLLLIVVGSSLAGVAGSLYGFWEGFVSTGSFGVELGVGFLLMVVLGGIGSMWGPVTGAMFYVFAPKLISSITTQTDIVYGVLLVIVMIVLPQGIAGFFQGHRPRSPRAAYAALRAFGARGDGEA